MAALPATSEALCLYLSDMASSLKPSTLTRRLSAISQAHQLAGHETPTVHARVRQVMDGIRRVKGTAARQVSPTLSHDVRAMLDTTNAQPIGIRDRAMLLVGFGAALRRSELVSLDFEDLEFSDRGLVVNLRRSKTDQTGEGRKIAIPGHQAADAVQQWLTISGIKSGALFRSVNRHGHISDERTNDKTVARVVKSRAAAAGLDPANYSGHSLRAGLATSAALGGASEANIARQTGHRSTAMVRRYVRVADIWRENVAGQVLAAL